MTPGAKNDTMDISDKVVIGDSWSESLNNHYKAVGWSQMLGFTKEEGNNLSIGGSRAVCWARNRNGALDAAIKHTAPIVLVSLMGNDLQHVWRDKLLTLKEVTKVGKAYIKVLDALDKKDIYVFTYGDPFQGKHEAVSLGVQFINNMIKLICDGHDNRHVIDLYKALNEKPLYFDGSDIHPTDAGHRRIASIVKGVFA